MLGRGPWIIVVVTYVSRDDVHNALRAIWLVDHPEQRCQEAESGLEVSKEGRQ
jgi:hypothetical protein